MKLTEREIWLMRKAWDQAARPVMGTFDQWMNSAASSVAVHNGRLGMLYGTVNEVLAESAPDGGAESIGHPCDVFLVWRAGCAANMPTKMHSTRKEATDEAKRLCAKTGQSFYVLEAVAQVDPSEPKVLEFRGQSTC